MTLGRWSVPIAIALGIVFPAYTPAMGQSQPAQNDTANSLPSSNLSADGPVDRSGLPRPAPGFANAHVASNPQVPDAKVVGEKTCIACHTLEADHFTHTLHSFRLSQSAHDGHPPAADERRGLADCGCRGNEPKR